MKQKLLLVEDDFNLGFVIKDKLQAASFEVCWRTDGESGLSEAILTPYDLVILDVMLPKKDGFSVGEAIHQQYPDVPIIFLTAKSMIDDRLKGLKIGNDYLSKPFEFEELYQRIINLLERHQKTNQESDLQYFEIGAYQFDVVNQLLVIDDEKKTLTKKEADLLYLFCINKNEVLSRELALKAIWGEDDYFKGRSMDVFVSRIRKYLKKDPSIRIINVHGVGFKLVIQ